MKIRQIRFRNINSFYGEHDPIQFASGLLGETGLFVISGPTGAGKSTLLDVITLALFNRLPRLSGAISGANISDDGLIVNRQAAAEPNAAAYAEVEYEVDGNRYRSRWSIRKNRNNNWNNYDMELAHLPDDKPEGNLFPIKNLLDFPKKNEELIGLSYEQFIKSIVLAQGAFDQFLKSRASERSKMLEKLTGTEIYRQLSRRAFDQNKWLDQQISDKRVSVSSIRMLSDDKVAELADQLDKADARLEELKAQTKLFEAEKKAVDDAEKAQIALIRCAKDDEKLQLRFIDFATDRLRLTQHDLVTPLAGLLTELAGSERALTNLKQNRAGALADTTQLATQLDEVLADAAKFTGKKKLIPKDAGEAIEIFRDQLKALQDQLSAAQHAASPLLQTVRQQAPVALGLKQLSLTDVALAQQQVDVETTTIQRQTSALQTTYANVLPATLPARLQQAIDRDKLLTTLALLEEQQQDRIVKGQKIAEPIDALVADIKANKPLLEAAQVREQVANEAIVQAEVAQRRISEEVNLTALREGLTEGNPCPLCGSLEHPYATHFVNQLGTITAQLLLAKDTYRQAASTTKRLSDTLIKQEAQLGEAERTRKALQDQFRAKRDEINDLREQYGIDKEAGPEAFKSEQRGLAIEQADLNTLRSLWEQLRTLQQIADQLTDLEKYNQIIQAVSAQKQQLFAGDNWAGRAGTLLKSLTDVQGRMATQTEVQRRLDEDERRVLADERRVLTALKPLLKKLNIDTAEAARERLLDTATTQRLRKLRDELDRDRIELDQRTADEQRRLDHAHKARKTDLPAADVKATFDAAWREHNKILSESGYARSALDSNKKSLASHQKSVAELGQMEADAMPWKELNKLIGSAKGDNFSKFAQSLTLAQLIGLANRRLKDLTDRYLLLSPRDEQEDLFVVDLYQGQAERTIASLSGGETFMLSLALALGLSDLASQNVQIDSLFIDEGFGTLDPDSLDTAIVMLEKLQQDSQKTIGIISHRHEIKERITVQIQVERGIDGNSRCYISS